jgi:hypothetical protein
MSSSISVSASTSAYTKQRLLLVLNHRHYATCEDSAFLKFFQLLIQVRMCEVLLTQAAFLLEISVSAFLLFN